MPEPSAWVMIAVLHVITSALAAAFDLAREQVEQVSVNCIGSGSKVKCEEAPAKGLQVSITQQESCLLC